MKPQGNQHVGRLFQERNISDKQKKTNNPMTAKSNILFTRPDLHTHYSKSGKLKLVTIATQTFHRSPENGKKGVVIN